MSLWTDQHVTDTAVLFVCMSKQKADSSLPQTIGLDSYSA